MSRPRSARRERDLEAAQDRAVSARYDMDAEAAAEADADAGNAAQDLARLAVADAARREWAEAHAGDAQAAREAEAELRRRDQAERVAQAGEATPEAHAGTGEEFAIRLDQMVAEAEGREWVPPGPEAGGGAAARAACRGGVPGAARPDGGRSRGPGVRAAGA